MNAVSAGNTSPGLSHVLRTREDRLTWLGFAVFLGLLWFIGACGGDPENPPDTPLALTIVTGEGGVIDTDGIFSASWSASTGNPDDYQIEYRLNGGVWQPVTGNITSTNFSAITLQGGFYEYRFAACNSAGCSDWSSPLGVTINLYSAAQALAENSPFDVYYGDINDDGTDDIGLHYRDPVVLLHSVSGTSASTVSMDSGQASYWLEGLPGGGFLNPAVWDNINLSDLANVGSAARLFDYDDDGDLDLFIDVSDGSVADNVVLDLADQPTPVVLATDIDFEQIGASLTVARNPADAVISDPDYYGVLRGDYAVGADGSFSYTLPIDVPPGINGMQPNMSLSYNSNRKNGVVGWGWALGGQSMISRCRATEFRDGYASSINTGADYKFCLDGQRLVEVAPNAYRTEVESHNLIWKEIGTGTAASPEYWLVGPPNGDIYTYATTKTDGLGERMQWYVSEHKDLANNRMTYSYDNNNQTGEFRLSRIDYGLHLTETEAPRSLRFEYEGRTDVRSGYRANQPYLINKRLKDIVTEVDGQEVSRYSLTYQEKVAGDTNYNDPVDTSRVKNIQRCFGGTSQCTEPLTLDWQDVHTISNGDWLNVGANLRYADFNGDGMLDVMGMVDEGDHGHGCEPSAGNGLATTVPTYDGSGKGTLFQMCAVTGGKGFNIYMAYGREKLAPGGDVAAYIGRLSQMLWDGNYSEKVVADIDTLENNTFTLFGDQIVYLLGLTPHGYGVLDFNNDGLPDIYVRRTPTAGVPFREMVIDVYLANPEPVGSSEDKFTFSQDYSHESGHSRYLYQDFNADGMVDYLRFSESVVTPTYYVALNNGTGFDAEQDWLANGHRITYNGPARDINGDGLIDAGGYTNTGDGFVDADAEANPPVVLGTPGLCTLGHEGVDYVGITYQGDYGDVNGDGVLDYVSQCAEGIGVALGTGNGGFHDEIWLPGVIVQGFYDEMHDTTPLWNNAGKHNLPIVLVDFNNDGLDDLMHPATREVWFSTGTGFNGPFETFGDATLFEQRYLLSINVGHDTNRGYPTYTDPLNFVDFDGDGLPDLADNFQAFKGFSNLQQVQSAIQNDNPPGKAATLTAKYAELLAFQAASVANPSGSLDVDDEMFVQHRKNELGGHRLLVIDEGLGRVITPEMTPVAQGNTYVNTLGSSGGNLQHGNLFDLQSYGHAIKSGKSTLGGARVANGASRYLTSSLDVSDPQGGSLSTSYQYSDLRQHRQGFGSLGFASRSETTTKPDDEGNLQTIHTVYDYYQDVKDNDTDLEKYTLAGRLKSERVYTGAVSDTVLCTDVVTENCLKLLSETRYRWKVRTYTDDIDAVGNIKPSPHYYVYLYDSTTASYDLSTGDLASQTVNFNHTIDTATATATCDLLTNAQIGLGANVDAILEASSNVDLFDAGVFKYQYQFQCDTDLSAQQVVMTQKSIAATTAKGFYQNVRGLINDRYDYRGVGANVLEAATNRQLRRTNFTYNSAGQLATENRLVNGLDAEKLTTTYTYNSYGTVASITESWATTPNDGLSTLAAPQRQSTVTETYSNGERTVVTTNALSQSSTTVYDKRFGLPISHTDLNSLETVTTYDNLGRVLTVTYPDITVTENRYLACTSDCFAYSDHEVWYAYTKTTGQSPGMVYYDGLGRELGSHTKNLEGNDVFIYREYDIYSRTTRQVDPFFAGGTEYATLFKFDLLDRLIQTTFADTTTHEITYSGTNETRTNREGQTQTREYNSAGWILKSTDNANTPVVFSYHPWGELASTMVNSDTETLVSISYDNLGRKTQLDDPNTGIINYSYNPLGLLATETDAKGQETRYEYDALGRQIQRIDDATGAVLSSTVAERTHTWSYDSALNGNGQLATMTGYDTQASPQPYTETYTYNVLSLPEKTTVVYEGRTQEIANHYDSFSRPLGVTYPTGYITANHYNDQGFLSKITDAVSNTVLWEAKSQDARGNITQFETGNGVVTDSTYKADTGRIESIHAHKGAFDVQNHNYNFSPLGNLTSRSDNANNIDQAFCYDNMNRLTATVLGTTCAPGTPAQTTYNALGNILTQVGVTGTMSYGVTPPVGTDANMNPGPHAMTGVNNKRYDYDLNGNLKGTLKTEGATIYQQQVDYSAFNKPTYFARTTNGVIDAATSIAYGPHKGRVKRVDTTGRTTRYIGGVYEETEQGGNLEQVHYIGDFALFVLTSGTVAKSETIYQHRDHIGSIVARTKDEVDSLDDVEYLANDAWGNRVQGMWGAAKEGMSFVPNYTARGFTDHEHLDSVGFIHMNGRVYDPEIGRMLSPDPLIQAPNNTQSYNRYSYVFNNPLSFTDPTGYSTEQSLNEITTFAVKTDVDTGSTSLQSDAGGFTIDVNLGGLSGLGDNAFDKLTLGIKNNFAKENNRKKAQKETDRDGVQRVFDHTGFRALTTREKATGIIKGQVDMNNITVLSVGGAQQNSAGGRSSNIDSEKAGAGAFGLGLTGVAVAGCAVAEPCGAVAAVIITIGGAASLNTLIDGTTGVNPINEALGKTAGRAVDVGSSLLFLPKRGFDSFMRILNDLPTSGFSQKIDDFINAGRLGQTLQPEE